MSGECVSAEQLLTIQWEKKNYHSILKLQLGVIQFTGKHWGVAFGGRTSCCFFWVIVDKNNTEHNISFDRLVCRGKLLSPEVSLQQGLRKLG